MASVAALQPATFLLPFVDSDKIRSLYNFRTGKLEMVALSDSADRMAAFVSQDMHTQDAYWGFVAQGVDPMDCVDRIARRSPSL